MQEVSTPRRMGINKTTNKANIGERTYDVTSVRGKEHHKTGGIEYATGELKI